MEKASAVPRQWMHARGHRCRSTGHSSPCIATKQHTEAYDVLIYECAYDERRQSLLVQANLAIDADLIQDPHSVGWENFYQAKGR